MRSAPSSASPPWLPDHLLHPTVQARPVGQKVNARWPSYGQADDEVAGLVVGRNWRYHPVGRCSWAGWAGAVVYAAAWRANSSA